MTEQEITRCAADVCELVAELWTRGPQAWTQNASAENAKGLPVLANSPEACAWCALGAAVRITTDMFPHRPDSERALIREKATNRVEALENRRLGTAYRGIHQINDFEWRTPAQAADAFRRASQDLRA